MSIIRLIARDSPLIDETRNVIAILNSRTSITMPQIIVKNKQSMDLEEGKPMPEGRFVYRSHAFTDGWKISPLMLYV